MPPANGSGRVGRAHSDGREVVDTTTVHLDDYLADALEQRACGLARRFRESRQAGAGGEAAAERVIRWAAETLRHGGPPPVPVPSWPADAAADRIAADLEWLGAALTAEAGRALREGPDHVDPADAIECVGAVRAAVGRVLVHAIAPAPDPDDETARRLEEFAQMVVHEIRTPLSHVQVGAEMLAQRAHGSPEDRTYLGWIQRGATRATELLEDLRVLALAEGAQTRARRLPVRELFDDVRRQVGDEANRRGVRIEVAEPVPDVRLDGIQIGLALLNLVGNAVKYADPLKPDRWVRLGVARVSGVVEGWRFTVVDNGLGIPERLQREVFRRNFRAHPAAADGMGLGLAITRRVIEQRQGHIWFHSEEGRGTTFQFVLPDRTRPELMAAAEPPRHPLMEAEPR